MKIMPFKRFHILPAVLGFLLPVSADAQVPDIVIPAASFGPLCNATGLCSNSPATGVFSVISFLSEIAIPTIQTVFIGVAVLYTAWFSLEMIIHGDEESALTEQKKAFGYAAVGLGTIGISSLIVESFAPSVVGTALVNPTPFTIGVERIVDFITIVTGVFLIFIIGFAGARIIALQGDESEVGKQRKNLFHSILGVPMLLLARIGINAVIPDTGEASDLIPEFAGIAKFLLEIIAGLSIVALFVSGFLYIVSLYNDSLKQRAKKILISTFVILIIVIFSHALVATFIPANTPASTF